MTKLHSEEWHARGHTEISFHRLKVLARKSPECSLTDFGLHALYEKLCNLRSEYDTRRYVAAADTTVPDVIPEELNTLIRAIARVAQFARHVEGAEGSAAEQGSLETERRGASAHLEALVRVARKTAHPVELIGTTETDVEGVFRRFLDIGSRLDVWIGRSQKSPVPSDYHASGWDTVVSPEQWLFGEALPDLYEAMFDRKYTINTGAAQKPHGRPIEFVRACLIVMKCYQPDGSAWSLETIKSYRRRALQARRVQRAGK